MSRILILFPLLFTSLGLFSQALILTKSPYYVKGKVNVLKDSATGERMPVETMDSLARLGKQQAFNLNNLWVKGDTAYWSIDFLTEAQLNDSSFWRKWLDKPFPFKDFIDLAGKRISRSDFTGKTVVINCWSISCAPCIKEFPLLNHMQGELGSKDYLFLGLTFDPPDSINTFFASAKLRKFLSPEPPIFNFRIIPGQNDLLTNQLGITGYPTTFVVNREGLIKKIVVGINYDENNRRQEFERLKDEIKNTN